MSLSGFPHCPGFRAYDWLLAAASIGFLHVTTFWRFIPDNAIDRVGKIEGCGR
jgi:hypothetical protein